MRHAMPGVRIERTDSARAEPLVLRTDIAAFVGLAERGPLDTPVAVESWRQFQAHFGERIGTAYLAYAVRGFFDNGGRRAWVVRVAARRFDGQDESASTARGSEGAWAARAILRDGAGRPCWRVAASSPGTWGNGLSVRLERERPLTQGTLDADPWSAGLASVAGFAVGELVELSQPGAPGVTGAPIASARRVLVLVDSAAGRLNWVHPDPRLRTPDQLPWTGLSATRPLQVSRVVYGLALWQRGVFLARWADLHPAPGHPRFVGRVLGPAYSDHLELLRAPALKDGGRQPPPPAPIRVDALDSGPGLGGGQVPLPSPNPEPLALTGGTDGLATLSVEDFLGRAWTPRESDLARLQAARGLRSLAAIDEIALIAIPDILIEPDPEPEQALIAPTKANPCRTCPLSPPAAIALGPPPRGERAPRFSESQIVQVQRTLLADCESRGDRFAVLSPPFARATDRARGVRALSEWRSLLTDREPVRAGALYAPWIGVAESDALNTSVATTVAGSVAGVRPIPACGHVIGAIARTDLRLGVMRAPANIPLYGLVDLRTAVGDDAHGALNTAGIDALRAEPGRIPAIQGARTLSDDPLWRYVSTVRMVQALRRAFETVLRFAVFEPNDGPTRAEVASTLIAVLTLFFERGAFAGATPDESFFVRCDTVSTDAAARERGELIALVGIAPAAPAEFVLLRVGRQDNQPRIAIAGDLSGETAGVFAGALAPQGAAA